MGAVLVPRQSEQNRQFSITVQDSLERVIRLAERAQQLPPALAQPVGQKLETIAKHYELLLTTQGNYQDTMRVLANDLKELAYEYKGHPLLNVPAQRIERLNTALETLGGFDPYIPGEDAELTAMRYNHLRAHINILLHGTPPKGARIIPSR